MGVPHIIGLIFSMLRASKATPEEIERIREKRLRLLLRKAVAQSPFYRTLYKGINIESCALSDLPVVDKKTMMENFDDFVTDRRIRKADIHQWLGNEKNYGKMYLEKYIAFKTSGTTGENALVIYDRHAMDFVHAALIARHAQPEPITAVQTINIILRALLIKRFSITALLMTGGPYPAFTIAAYPPLFYNLFVKYEVHSLLEPLSQVVEKLNASSCNELYSYPTMLEMLAREQIEGRLRLKIEQPLATIASASEPLTERVKKLVQKAWGMKIQDTYGSAECFIMARSCGQFKRMHVMSDLCFLEVVDHQGKPVPDGQTGDKVLITNLFNFVQPFIRYEVSDVTGYSGQPCSCGQPFPTLLQVEGRTDDIFYIDRSGGGYDAVHPYLFLGPIVEMSQVREYQLVQTGRNEITFYYVSVKSVAEVENQVRKVFESGISKAGLSGRVAIKTMCVKTIPRDHRSGKVRQIISQVGVPKDLDKYQD